jgi:GTPase
MIMDERTTPERGEHRETHPTRRPRERAFLVGAELADVAHRFSVEDSLAELGLLADTAGLVVVGQTAQKLKRPTARFLVGSGKVEEIAARRDELGYDLVIFDDELSPGQARNLEDEIGAPVRDRTELILDIFAQHARTREGRLQVELAQYTYLLPRVGRQGRHSGRQGGTGSTGAGGMVGLRGPGETPLELDRRIIRRRIGELRQELEEVHRQRELHRTQRRESLQPVVALVGYTNAGKSTLLNALTSAGVRAEDRLFATLDPVTRQATLPGGRQVLFTDTVGFIQKLPTQLVAAFRATLEEIHEADLLLHVLDGTHPNARAQAETVLETLEDLGAGYRPRLTVLNKVDRRPDWQAAEIEELAWRLGLPDDYVAVSALTGSNLDGLLERVDAMLTRQMVEVAALIPYARGDLLALWRQQGVIVEEEHLAEGTRVVGRLPEALVAQVEPFRPGRGRARTVGG